MTAKPTYEELERRIKKLEQEMEERVKKRTRELEKAVQAAGAASQAKSDFMASMSHELRTPLNAVIGFSEVLLNKYFGPLNEKQEKYTRDILKSGRHLLSLINDILDLSKVEAGKTELERSHVNIKNLITDSVSMIKERAYQQGINLKIEIHPELEGTEISADERKLKQILFNLLSNAAKFTSAGGTIAIDIKKEDHELIFSVSDTGIGIDPENQTKVFDEFYQIKTVGVERTEGTGLGLPLTKSFVEMHKGKIWLESEGIGKGSRFSFTLPIVSPMEDIVETIFVPPVWGIYVDEQVVSFLDKTIKFSKTTKKPFSWCRWPMDIERLREKGSEIKIILEKEKRENDFCVLDHYGGINIILQGADSEKAAAACDRYKKKVEIAIGVLKVSCSTVVFPTDGETPETLLEKVGFGF